MSGFLSLSKALLRGFVRDKVTLFFTLVFPLMFLVILGSLFSSDTPPSKVVQVGDVAAIDELQADSPDEAERLFDLDQTDELDAALESVRQGDVDAAIRQDGEKVQLYVSKSNQTRAAVVTSTLDGIIDERNVRELSAEAPDVPVTTVKSESVDDQSLSMIQYLTPGLLGWAVSIGGVFGAAATLVDWRKNKILRRLRLSPVTIPAVIGARVGVSLVNSLMQFVVFIAVASLPVFGLQLTGYWWMAIPVLLVGTLTFLSLGMVVGSIARTGEGASGLSNLVVMPMAFASGSFFPLDSAPGWLQAISYVSPLRYINDALLAVMVRGEGPLSVMPQLGLLLAFTLVCALITSRIFNWDEL